MRPSIIATDHKGFHNGASYERLIRGQSYKDLSTVCVIPTRGQISAKVVQSWMGLIPPMNQKFTRLFVQGMEVAEAYNAAVDAILSNPELKKWKFMLTLEEDNLPPPDGLLRLYESMDKFDAVGGLYWTKGEAGQPMIYGHPKEMPKTFIPQIPLDNALQECNGLGMGFTLFRLAMFKNLPKPWFKTVQDHQPGKGTNLMTQDLYFFHEAGRDGYRFACDTRVKVGHYSFDEDKVW